MLGYAILGLAVFLVLFYVRKARKTPQKAWKNVKLLDEIPLDQLKSIYKRSTFELWEFNQLFCLHQTDSLESLKLISKTSIGKSTFDPKVCERHQITPDECEIF